MKQPSSTPLGRHSMCGELHLQGTPTTTFVWFQVPPGRVQTAGRPSEKERGALCILLCENQGAEVNRSAGPGGGAIE